MAHHRGKNRSLSSQVNHMVCEGIAFGTSKHADKKAGHDTQKKFYSVMTRNQALDFFRKLTREVQSNHPEVRMIRDIQEKHVQEFFDRHSPEWTSRTCGQNLSLVRKFSAVANNQYKSCHLDFSNVKVNQWKEEPTGREHGMTESQAKAVIANMNPDSMAAPVPEITFRIATRLEEAVGIRPDQVIAPCKKYPLGAVELTETKGGRIRTCEFQTKEDLRFFENLRNQAVENGWPTLVGGIKPNTAAKEIRNAMDKAGLSKEFPRSGNHAIRKCRARMMHEENIANGMNPKESAGRVQDYLGHGKQHRPELFRTYVDTELEDD